MTFQQYLEELQGSAKDSQWREGHFGQKSYVVPPLTFPEASLVSSLWRGEGPSLLCGPWFSLLYPCLCRRDCRPTPSYRPWIPQYLEGPSYFSLIRGPSTAFPSVGSIKVLNPGSTVSWWSSGGNSQRLWAATPHCPSTSRHLCFCGLVFSNYSCCTVGNLTERN